MDDVTDALDRRTALRLGAIGFAGGLVGCLEEEEDRPGPTGDDPEDPEAGQAGDTDDGAAVVDVGFDGLNSYDPETVDIEAGETVVWEWASDGHTVTPEEIPEDSDWEGVDTPEDEGHSHRHTFEVEGEFQYVCDEHREDGMEGRVLVGDVEERVQESGGDPEAGAAESGENQSETDEEGNGTAGGTYDGISGRY